MGTKSWRMVALHIRKALQNYYSWNTILLQEKSDEFLYRRVKVSISEWDFKQQPQIWSQMQDQGETKIVQRGNRRMNSVVFSQCWNKTRGVLPSVSSRKEMREHMSEFGRVIGSPVQCRLYNKVYPLTCFSFNWLASWADRCHFSPLTRCSYY